MLLSLHGPLELAMHSAGPLHVIVSSPSTPWNALLPLFGLMLGSLLTYWLSGAASRRLRRNERRFRVSSPHRNC